MHIAKDSAHGGCNATRRSPICCIIPPYVLQGIVENGPKEAKEKARATLELDGEIRAERLERSIRLLQRPQMRRRMQGAFATGWWAAVRAFNKERAVYDAENGRRLPGTKVRGEGDPPTNDLAVDEAYDGLGATFDLYSEEFDRNSIDDQGMRLDATVHFDRDYNNAFWDGRQMVFGDGDGIIFNRFTISIDVMGHELAHGVTEHEAGLIYLGQSGALNESVSDVFGSLVKQRQLGQTADEADWLIGEGLFTDQVNGEALRSMKAPGTAYDDPKLGGKDPQPGHMNDYVKTFEDNFGVHINSGIPNRAFYLAAQSIGGNAWEDAGLVWYETLRSPSTRPFMQFRGFAWLTVITATQLFGQGDPVPQAVYEAWREVGVLP